MGQTLSRDPAVSDVLFVHLWCSVLGKAVGRRIEEQADSCCRQKSICWQRGSQVSQFPLAPLTSLSALAEGAVTCSDAQVKAGASVPPLPVGWWLLVASPSFNSSL